MAKRKYTHYLISSEFDFYIADALCRVLEKEGFYCYYNIRDSKKNDKTPDAFFNFADECTIILVASDDLMQKQRCEAMFDTLLKHSDFKFVILKNDENFAIPEKWKHIKIIDVSRGLNKEIVSIVSGENTVSDKSQINNQILPSASSSEEESINSKVSQSSSPSNLTPKPIYSSPANFDESEKIDGKSSRTEDKPIQERPSITPKGENNRTEGLREAEDDSITRNMKHSWSNEEIRNAHKRLRTIMTAQPKNFSADHIIYNFDKVSEAYLVPLYVLEFDKFENVFDKTDLFCHIENPSMTIQRALRYLNGEGVPQDDNRAYSLFQKALNDCPTVAKYCLAICHEFGIGISRNYETAIQLYRESYKEGYVPATAHLGSLLHFSGNTEEAIPLLIEARESGELEASYTLGVIADERGEIDDAIEFYSEAAELGYAKAQNMLAAKYYNGDGVAANKKVALEWLNSSMSQGFIGAKYNTIVHNINSIEKADLQSNDQIWDYLEKEIIDACNSINKEFNGYNYPILLAGLKYNIAILSRRGNNMIESTKSWLDLPQKVGIPYVEEFYKHYEEEKKRRERKAMGISAMNAIGTVLGALSGEDYENSRGGYFDKNREI